MNDASRHFAILGAVLVAALQLTPLIGDGEPAALFLVCLTTCAAVSIYNPRVPCVRAAAALVQLILAAVALHALSSLIDVEALSGRAFALLSALWLLERGATFTQRLRVLARVGRRKRCP